MVVEYCHWNHDVGAALIDEPAALGIARAGSCILDVFEEHVFADERGEVEIEITVIVVIAPRPAERFAAAAQSIFL